MNFFQSIVVGIIQGLTEFIPISSTAHVRIIPALLGWADPGAAITAVTQLGTLVAVLAYFRSDIITLTKAGVGSIFNFKSRESWNESFRRDVRLAWFIVLGTIPLGVLGILFKEQIETDMRSLTIIGWSLICLAIVLAVAEISANHRKTISELGFGDTQIIGLAQAVALVPGASRSGVTITAGLFLGLTREAAARFSFLLSIPAVLASGLLELRTLWKGGFGDADWLNLLIATVVAGIVGYASIAFLLRWLQSRSTSVFILYRILLGGFILWMSGQGWIQ